MLKLTILIALASAVWAAAAQEAATPAAPPATAPASGRKPALYDDPVEPVYDTAAPYSSNRAGGFGVMVQGYYDPLTPYLKTVTSTSPTLFGSTTGTGLGGMQVLVSYEVRHFEFATGFDYIFQVNEQGTQAFTGQFAVNSQTLNVMGLKLIQAGYDFKFGNFGIIPYAGVGVYYGRDVLSLYTNTNVIDTVTLSKLMAMFTAGVRGEYSFTKNFSLNAALEADQPVGLQTDLAQSGGTGGELPGYESSLQSQMDYMTSTGLRIIGGVKVSF